MNIVEFAKQEYSRYLGMMGVGEKQQNELVISLNESSLDFDGYSVRVKGGTVHISSAQERGILYGVYEFLRYIGYDFIFPGDENIQIPTMENFPPKEVVIEKNPVIEYRGICFYGTTSDNIEHCKKMVDWMAKNNFNLLLTSIHRPDDSVNENHAILWDEISGDLLPELEKRGIAIDMSEHSTDYFISREKWFELHPEWFSLIDGKRVPSQLCYSNKDAVAAYAKAYVDFVKQHPEMHIVGVWPLDGGGYCECEDCKDPLALYNAAAYVADEIHKIRPDILVESLQYKEQSLLIPPKGMAANMTALVCRMNNKTAYDWGVAAKKSGGAFYFEYHTGDHYRFRSNVWINPAYCRETVNTFFSYGYRGIVSLFLPCTVWWAPCINYYFLREAYYNPLFNINDECSKLIEKLFGKENSALIEKIFAIMQGDLQDRSIWSREPFVYDYFEEHTSNRIKKVDELHLLHFKQASESINELVNKLDISIPNDFNKKQIQCFLNYIDLQKLFFEQIDQYNPMEDTVERINPYLQKLEMLEREIPEHFITRDYARWRISERDNILRLEKSSEFEA